MTQKKLYRTCPSQLVQV